MYLAYESETEMQKRLSEESDERLAYLSKYAVSENLRYAAQYAQDRRALRENQS